MDLGAFLRPGDVFSITLTAEDQALPHKGRLLERRGRPVWLSSAPWSAGGLLTIAVTLDGYRIDEEGNLAAAGQESGADIRLLARVKACRLYPPERSYVLRLKLLGRVWPTGAGR